MAHPQTPYLSAAKSRISTENHFVHNNSSLTTCVFYTVCYKFTFYTLVDVYNWCGIFYVNKREVSEPASRVGDTHSREVTIEMPARLSRTRPLLRIVSHSKCHAQLRACARAVV